jgi:excisionase family DNA binding protein
MVEVGESVFFRSKRSGARQYLQIVENHWENGKNRQRILANVGRLDKLQKSGELEKLLKSGSRFCPTLPDSTVGLGDEVGLSPAKVGRLLSVNASTVVAWIDRGRLPAYRTIGGHRRVRPDDLRRFATENGFPVPWESRRPDGPHKILVVDDDPQVLRSLQRGFRSRADDFEVDGCYDGIEALVMIGAVQPDLILLDIYMEGIDGFEVCRRLKAIPGTTDLRIIAITSFPSEEARARILDYGALDYWVKPISPEQIIEFVQMQPEAEATGRMGMPAE